MQPGLSMTDPGAQLAGHGEEDVLSPRHRRVRHTRGRAAKPMALLVEDDPDAATVAASMLQILGFETSVAADAQQALTALTRGKPDLVVLDICLPDLSGADVLRILRRLREHADTPVLAVSAVYAEGNQLTRTMEELGIIGYLAKPFSFSQLRTAVADVLPEAWQSGEHRLERVPDLEPEPEPEPEAESYSDLEAEYEGGLTSSQSGVQVVARVRALVKHRGQRYEAILEEGNVDSVTVRITSPVRVGDQLQLRVYAGGGAKRARVRLMARVDKVLSRRKRRYRAGRRTGGAASGVGGSQPHAGPDPGLG